jgi:steroid delta-isomerase-like uncharacterized protein
MTTSTTSGSTVVRELIDHLNAHDTQAMRALWTDGIVERFPDRTCHGPGEVAAYFDGVFAALPDFRMEILATAENGETVFLHWRATGTHTGAKFQGIAPTGKAVQIDGMDHFVVHDGKVVTNFVVFDQMDFGRQLGLMPPDGSVPDRALKAGFNALVAARARIGR